eukprot:PhM_4_TR3461/c0_g1_i3/m.60266
MEGVTADNLRGVEHRGALHVVHNVLVAIANSGERFNAITCRSQFLDVLHGLQYLHNKNIVHMDVKPENILICEDGSTKLSDFGVSAMIDGNFECSVTFRPQHVP